MATEVIATEGEAIYAWMIWILPFIAALIIPAVGKFSKISTGRVAVGFAAMSAFQLQCYYQWHLMGMRFMIRLIGFLLLA